MGSRGEVVCVTGGSGYIGSWLVQLLLCRGYTVHATVKNLDDEKETKHLQAMEGAQSRLRLFRMDLLHYDSIVAAVTGAAGVFHVASPCIVDEVRDPEGDLLDPAIKGTINVLTAAKEVGVRRVVVTSSVSAIIPSPNWPADKVKNEDCWTDEEYCKRNGVWYPLSKTLAEKAAWKFAKENGVDIVVVNPGTVMGPIIPPAINASMLMILRLLQGCKGEYEDFFMGSVHVKDVALAHILVYENTEATGRHLCVEAISHYGDFAAKVAELYPEYNVPRIPKDTQPGLLRTKEASKKLIDLGLQFVPMEQIIMDSVESLRSKNMLKVELERVRNSNRPKKTRKQDCSQGWQESPNSWGPPEPKSTGETRVDWVWVRVTPDITGAGLGSLQHTPETQTSTQSYVKLPNYPLYI